MLPWKAMWMFSNHSWRQACFTQLTVWLMVIQCLLSAAAKQLSVFSLEASCLPGSFLSFNSLQTWSNSLNFMDNDLIMPVASIRHIFLYSVSSFRLFFKAREPGHFLLPWNLLLSQDRATAVSWLDTLPTSPVTHWSSFLHILVLLISIQGFVKLYGEKKQYFRMIMPEHYKIMEERRFNTGEFEQMGFQLWR